MARLRAVRYHVDADDAFDTGTREAHYQPLGSLVADALTELTASHDGVLIALGEVLTATAAFYQGLGQAPDPHTAKRLQYLGEHRLGVIRSDLTLMRNDLADRHQNHPQRRACTADVGPGEREASAICACPAPPPRLTTSPAAAPAAAAPANRRR